MDIMDAIGGVWFMGLVYLVMNKFFDWRSKRGA